MVTKSKRKGSTWERDAVKLLSNAIPNSSWRRVPTSGAIGTLLNESLLCGDIVGKIEGYPKTFRGEAKVGYGGEKQFALKKEWLDKIHQEAYQTFSIPFLIGKFSGARSGIQHFVVLDFETFADLLAFITNLSLEFEKVSNDIA